MKRPSTIFLQIFIVFIGIGTIIWMLWEPHIEGRNAHATLFEIYFKDPFLLYAYFASIAFFLVLYQTFRLLGYIRLDKAFTPQSVNATRIIKFSALSLVAFVLPAVAYLFITRPGDDIAGGIAMGLFIIFFSVITACAADIFEGLFQSVADTKPENNRV